MTPRSPAPDVVPVAAPPRVVSWLSTAPDGPVAVLHLGRDTVHLDVAGRAVGVATAAAPRLPHTLITNLETLPAVMSSSVTFGPYLEGGSLHLGGRVLVTGRIVDVRAPRLDSARIPMASPAAALGTPRSRGAGLVPSPASLGAVPRAITADVVEDLVGRGDGLTPLGDDVLCGWLAGHRAACVPTPAVDGAVRRALPRTTTLSATLLECALAGECAGLVSGYLRAIGTPRQHEARTALESLGHSSGAGLAHGVDLALAAVVGRAAA